MFCPNINLFFDNNLLKTKTRYNLKNYETYLVLSNMNFKNSYETNKTKLFLEMYNNCLYNANTIHWR